MRVNRLSFSDLSRFGRGNDRLSFLRSSSPTSSTQHAKADSGSRHDVIDEAKAAISGWQDEPRPLKRLSYNHYELADSSDVLPCDSMSQRGSPQASAPEAEAEAAGSDGHCSKDGPWHSVEPIKDQ